MVSSMSRAADTGSLIHRLGPTAAIGAVAGVGASVVMAVYAMIASVTYQHHGFFTPLYHIASLFIAPDELMKSVQVVATGDKYYFAAGPAILGAVIHMMTGAIYGAAFAVVLTLLRQRGPAVAVAGAIWGFGVFAFSTWVGLPLAAAIFNSGDQITHMAKLVGYGTFIPEHIVFGLVLGLLVILRPSFRRT